MRTRGHRLSVLAAVTVAATALAAPSPSAGSAAPLAASWRTAPAVVAQVISPSRIAPVDGQAPDGTLPNRLRGVGIVEDLGARVPQDAPFVDEAGRTVRLADVLGRGRPVMLTFAYHSCPMLCSLVLDGVAEAVAAEDGLRPGRDYEVVVLSVDPRDTPARARAAKERTVGLAGDSAVAAGMHFWTVTPETEASVKNLAASVGFGYAWDARTQEFAHHAALMLLSPEGVLTRYLYGIAYAPRDVRLALVEAGDGTIGTPFDRFLVTCYEFDDEARSYSLAAMTLLKWGGGLTLLVVGGGLLAFWRREGRRSRQAGDHLAASSLS